MLHSRRSSRVGSPCYVVLHSIYYVAMALPATIHMYYVEFSFRNKTKPRESSRSRLELNVETRHTAYWIEINSEEVFTYFQAPTFSQYFDGTVHACIKIIQKVELDL